MANKNIFGLLLALVAYGLLSRDAQAWVDDYDITISSPAEIASRRAQLIGLIWGAAGFPLAASELVDSDISSPVSDLDNLERVEKLRTTMPAVERIRDKDVTLPIVVTSYHFIPARKRNRLVVVHNGHTCPGTFDNPWSRDTIKALLHDGYGVLAVFMPLISDDQCIDGYHPRLFYIAPTGKSGMAYFLEPTAKSLSYVAQHYPSYLDFSMLGFSGGGWTTTVYAAIDPRIKVSISVAGSIPLYLRSSGYSHDEEQFHAAFYAIAGYPDLYILGSYGPGRRQIQVMNRYDPCCFSQGKHDTTLPHVADKPAAAQGFEPSVRAYEDRVNEALGALGPGTFRAVIEEISQHTLSDHTIQSVVRPALNGGTLEPVLLFLLGPE
jgi:pimeloyl-ACP methyl ester carboxylesterase